MPPTIRMQSRRSLLLSAMGSATVAALSGCGSSDTRSAAPGQPGIWLVDVSTGDLRRVAAEPSRPAWSPNGQNICWSDANGIWVVSSEGIDPRRILGIQGASPPAFSPDGRRIAVFDPERHELCIVDADGRNARTAAVGQSSHAGGAAPAVQRNIPSWAPDGSALVVSGWDGNGDHIYRIDHATGDAVGVSDLRLSDAPFDSGVADSPMRAVANAVWPAWSPDGRTIAFAGLPQVSRAQGGIYTVPASGGDQKHLAPIVPTFGPIWSPDSSRLAAIAPTDKGIRIVLVDAASGDMSAFPMADGVVPIDAAWSPDGAAIAFSDGNAIRTIDIATGAARVITDTPLVDLSPAWSPNGASIAFRSEPDSFQQPLLPPVS